MNFAGRNIRWAIVLALGLQTGASFAAAPAEPRGGRVGWARLITPNAAWQRHAESDGILSRFIRTETSLNIDVTWYSADPAHVDKLCSYPLIFTNNLTDIQNPQHLGNVAEYLRRGGFLFVDSCINSSITRDPDRFLQRHIETFTRLFPQSKIRQLPADHEIYRRYFAMSETPPHSYMSSVYDPRWHRHGLYGVSDGERMIALLSLSGLQCGWAGLQHPDNGPQCMRMAVNIYVYAMTTRSQ
jgi:hypothetical protein